MVFAKNARPTLAALEPDHRAHRVRRAGHRCALGGRDRGSHLSALLLHCHELVEDQRLPNALVGGWGEGGVIRVLSGTKGCVCVCVCVH